MAWPTLASNPGRRLSQGDWSLRKEKVRREGGRERGREGVSEGKWIAGRIDESGRSIEGGRGGRRVVASTSLKTRLHTLPSLPPFLPPSLPPFLPIPGKIPTRLKEVVQGLKHPITIPKATNTIAAAIPPTQQQQQQQRRPKALRIPPPVELRNKAEEGKEGEWTRHALGLGNEVAANGRSLFVLPFSSPSSLQLLRVDYKC